MLFNKFSGAKLIRQSDFYLAFSDSDENAEQESVLVIEPQVAAGRDLNINEDNQSGAQFASNAGQVHAKLSHNFMCKCSFFKGSNCSFYFGPEQLVSHRMKHLEMDRDVLDMIILSMRLLHLPLNAKLEDRKRLFVDVLPKK